MLCFVGGSSADIVMVNSFVHVVMYGYYFITNKYPEYKKNVWWKKHITQLQLVSQIIFIVVTLEVKCKIGP